MIQLLIIQRLELLNSYFSTLFTQENIDKLPHHKQVFKGNNEKLSEVDLSPKGILIRLLKLKPDKAPGVDGIMPVILKEIVLEISQPFSVLFKASMEHLVVLDDWRQANVAPLFKKGRRVWL